MHSLFMLLSVALAIALRLLIQTQYFQARHCQGRSKSASHSWQRRWNRALAAFALPPLFILAMAVAVFTMDIQGVMLGHAVGNLGHGAAAVALMIFSWALFTQTMAARRSKQNVQALPRHKVQGQWARRLQSNLPFAARVGFWRSELVISSGIHSLLSPQELEAVLCHEQAHLLHRDTFWFFWLGWLRSATAWLPASSQLWEELLLLREMRADRWAAKSVDSLLLAESLLKMAQAATSPEPGWVMFAEAGKQGRLAQRIDQLLDNSSNEPEQRALSVWMLLSVLVVAVPFLTHLLHSGI